MIIILLSTVLELVVWIILHVELGTGVHSDVLYALYLAVGKVDLEILMNEEIFFLQKLKKQLCDVMAYFIRVIKK